MAAILWFRQNLDVTTPFVEHDPPPYRGVGLDVTTPFGEHDPSMDKRQGGVDFTLQLPWHCLRLVEIESPQIQLRLFPFLTLNSPARAPGFVIFGQLQLLRFKLAKLSPFDKDLTQSEQDPGGSDSYTWDSLQWSYSCQVRNGSVGLGPNKNRRHGKCRRILWVQEGV